MCCSSILEQKFFLGEVVSTSSFRSMRMVLSRMLNKDLITPRLLVTGAIAGAIIGVVCSLFELLPTALDALRIGFLIGLEQPLWVQLLCAFVVSFVFGGLAIFLTRKFAPEAGGSGIPEIEGAMLGLRPVRWHRVLPVKFFGGLLSLSSGMVLGREGPSIQIGGNVGMMVARILRLKPEDCLTLLAAGGAAGLASAFNAPLAGIMFVLEELRLQFKFNYASVQAVSVTVLSAAIVRGLICGTDPVFLLPHFSAVDMSDLIFFLVFGIVMGGFGVIFNKGVNLFQNIYQMLYGKSLWRPILIVGCVAGVFGILSLVYPELSTSGMKLIPGWILSYESTSMLALVLLARVCAIFLCFCSGIPGGIFAPSLSIGALAGSLFGIMLVQAGYSNFNPGIMAIVGMGTFFAASVRAPVTGIILVCEMTGNFNILLPMLVSVSAASYIAGILNGSPIYTQILERTLRLSKDKKALGDFESFKEKHNL